MLIPEDGLTTLFHDEKYHFYNTPRDYLKRLLVLIVSAAMTIILCLLLVYIFTKFSYFKALLFNFPLAIITAVPFLVCKSTIAQFGAGDYLIALDEAAQYLVTRRTYGSVRRVTHHDLHKIKKIDMNREPKRLVMQMSLDNGETAEVEVPNEEIVQYIRHEIRRVLDSNQEPDLERRKLYDFKAFVSIGKSATDHNSKPL